MNSGAVSPRVVLTGAVLVVLGLLMAAAVPAELAASVAEDSGGDHGGGHGGPFPEILLVLAIVLSLAMLGRFIATRVKQAKVLGELMVGVAIGNLGYQLGIPIFDLLMNFEEAQPVIEAVWRTGESVENAAHSVYPPEKMAEGESGARMVELMTGAEGVPRVFMGLGVWLFSKIGVILLLFMVGLHSNVREILGVGGSASRVALVGVALPLALGYFASQLVAPGVPATTHLFVAAALCATSVGITARVLMDLGALETPSARVILGAAVLDDVLGLVLLALTLGVASTGSLDTGNLIRIVGLSAVFLTAVIAVGERYVAWSARIVRRLDPLQGKILFPVAFAFACGWVASMIGLDPIVGAFAAGLLIRDTQFGNRTDGHVMERLFEPVEALFAPVFFVLIGAQVNLAVFADVTVLGLAAVLLVAAIIGKGVAGLVAGKSVDGWTIGIGMVPRGEVGLVFASMGRAAGILPEGLFSALVVVIVLTTLATPPALRWSVARMRRRAGDADSSPAAPAAVPVDADAEG